MRFSLINGFPNYIVYEDGTVINTTTNRVMKQREIRGGYMGVGLSSSGKQKLFPIHRLVAVAFVPNPNNYPCVNHKDENKKNNNADNLEWCTQQYNINYGTANERRLKSSMWYRKSEKAKMIGIALGERSGRRVEQLTLDGKHVALYQSARKASIETGINHCYLCQSAREPRRTAGGYKWKYVKEE